MHIGTALCSMRSELEMRSLFTALFSRSYSTYYSAPHKHKVVYVLNIWYKNKKNRITKHQTSPQTYNFDKVD